MGVTVKKCHMIMSENDCWNSVCFSCCRKADNELADVTLSCRLFETTWTNRGSVVSLHAEPCMSEQPFCTVSVLQPATSGD